MARLAETITESGGLDYGELFGVLEHDGSAGCPSAWRRESDALRRWSRTRRSVTAIRPKKVFPKRTQRIRVTTIRVTDKVKERLRDLKRDDESFNDLLDKLSRSRTDVEATAGFLGEIVDGQFADRVDQTHEELNESFDSWPGR